MVSIYVGIVGWFLYMWELWDGFHICRNCGMVSLYVGIVG